MEMDFLGGNGNGGVGSGSDNGGLVFDLAGVDEDKGFELLPKGKYNAIVDEVSFGDSSGGNAMLTVVYQVTEGEFEGRKLWDFFVLEGNGAEYALPKLKKFLVRICPDVDMSNFNPDAFANSGTAVGRECTISVTIQTQKKGERKGEKQNRVADIEAVSAEGSFL